MGERMIKNLPKIIYFQIGEDCGAEDFKEIRAAKGEITWCEDKINENDIAYQLINHESEGCVWELNEQDDHYDTSCGCVHDAEDIRENGMFLHCHFCGKEIKGAE